MTQDKTAENRSVLKKVGMASFIMMASVFSSRVIGLAREAAIALDKLQNKKRKVSK
ncbi:MAG: hypothetical protein U9P10_13350 [Thermodesulfobacteriota bacterium]|nr:hypothetical protein [Thermodesulfobacteriota bacterium]